jgi:hypothetical protein
MGKTFQGLGNIMVVALTSAKISVHWGGLSESSRGIMYVMQGWLGSEWKVSCWAYLVCHVTFAEDTANATYINAIIIYTTMAMYSPITICPTPDSTCFRYCGLILTCVKPTPQDSWQSPVHPHINATVLYQLLVCFPEFLVIIWLALWTFPLLLWTSYDFSVASMMLCCFPMMFAASLIFGNAPW